MTPGQLDPELNAAIAFEDVSLWIPQSERRRGGGRRHRLRRLAGEVQRSRRWIVRQASAKVGAGEVVAVVGMRIWGLESILRLASGTLLADSGRVLRSDPVVPNISLARCMDRRLTIRQNIYLIGGLLGLAPVTVPA